MPEPLDGIRAIREIRTLHRYRPAVVVFTALAGTDQAMESLGAGAIGFVAKSDPPHIVGAAVHAAARGGAFISPMVLVHLLPRLGSSPEPTRGLTCTTRELEVLGLLARGLTNQEIHERLYISVATVATHVQHLREKLCARNRSELVIIGLGLRDGQPGADRPTG